MRKSKILLFALILVIILIANVLGVSQKKHIVFIVADDLGVYDIGSYGGDFIETPFLDSITKSQGFLKCTKAYSSGPICSPTRASIISGLAPARHGMTEHLRGTPPVSITQRMIPPINATSLSQDLPTIAKLAKQNAYKTSLIGKWHLGGVNQRPALYGYDFTYAGGSPGLPISFFYPFFNPGTFPELEADSKSGDYLDDVLADRAVKYIRDNKDSSFFLHLNFYAPHVPIMAKDHLIQKYTSKRQKNPNQTLPSVHYAAMVEGLDQNIAKVIRALSSIGDLSEMLVIITSDHGGLNVMEVEPYAEHTPATDNGILREGKGYLYEGGIRVPMIINRGKRNIDPDAIINTTDFFNTVADFIGKSDRTSDGQSLYSKSSSTPQTQFWHFPHYSPQAGSPMSAILASPYKLIHHWDKNYTELFNLTTDPGETLNIIHQDPSRATKLKADLFKYIDTIKGKLPVPNPKFRPEFNPIRDSFSYQNTDLALCNEGQGWYSQYDKVLGSILIESGKLALQQTAIYTRHFKEPIDLVGHRSYWFTIDLSKESNAKGVTNIALKGTDSRFFNLKFEAEINKLSLSIGEVEKSITLSNPSSSITIKLSLSSSSDSIYLWSKPLTSSIPASSQADFSIKTIMPNEVLDYIQIAHTSTTNGKVFIDNINIGARYNDLVPKANLPIYAYEPFDYTAAEALESQGYNDGGWAGSWYRSGTFNAANISNLASISLNVPSQNALGLSTKFDYKVANSQIRLNRDLDTPMLSDGSTYWISFIMDIDKNSAINNIANLTLVNKNIADNGGMRLSIGRSYATGKIALINPTNGSKKDSPINDSGTHHILAAIVTKVGDVPDSVYLWIDKPISRFPVFSQADASINISSLAEGANSIRLRAEGTGNGQTPLIASFDEIIISNAYPFSNLISSLSDLSLQPILVYPNPFTSTLNLDLSTIQEDIFQINIYDNLGRHIHTANHIRSSDNMILDSSILPSPGYYYLQMIGLRTLRPLSPTMKIHKTQ